MTKLKMREQKKEPAGKLENKKIQTENAENKSVQIRLKQQYQRAALLTIKYGSGTSSTFTFTDKIYQAQKQESTYVIKDLCRFPFWIDKKYFEEI